MYNLCFVCDEKFPVHALLVAFFCEAIEMFIYSLNKNISILSTRNINLNLYLFNDIYK